MESGLKSRIPQEWRELETIYRPEYNSSSLAAAVELRGLTGLALSDLVVFRPERLALHELLIRVTADFAVPDGSRIEDLGINFRRIANRILTGYLDPERQAIGRVFDEARRQVTDAVEAGWSDVLRSRRSTAGVPRKSGFWARRWRAVPAAGDLSWDAGHIAECERRASAAPDPLGQLVHRTLARILAGLFSAHGRAWGTRELIVPLARDLACNMFASDAIGAAIAPVLKRAAAAEGYGLLPSQDRPVVINTKGASASERARFACCRNSSRAISAWTGRILR